MSRLDAPRVLGKTESSDDTTMYRIEAPDFVRMFGIMEHEFPPGFLDLLSRTDTSWRSPTQAEIEEYILDLLKKISGRFQPRSVQENREAFEAGWQENLDEVLAQGPTAGSLKPKYFRNTRCLRYAGSLVISDNHNLEYDLFVLARHIIFWKYLRDFPKVYEFGCGSCANLLMLSELFPDKELMGLDWVQPSVNIAEQLAQRDSRRIQGALFDLLDPPEDFMLGPGSAAITIHALEQLGERFVPWVEFVLRVKPALVVNYEPVVELYDEDNLWDYLAVLYSKKRGYLNGYLTALRRLEEEGRIEILEQRRPYLGGVLHESSLLVWRPI